MRWNDNVQVGMFVTGTNGEKLGKVIRCDEDSFLVEKGMFFPKDYELGYEYITNVEGNAITYELAQANAQPETAVEPERSVRTAEASRPTAPAAASALGGAAAAESSWRARHAEKKAEREAEREAEPRKPIASAFKGAAPAESDWSVRPVETRQPVEPAAAPASRGAAPGASDWGARPAEARQPYPPATSEGAARPGDADAQGSRIALMDEELDVEKVSRETGHVRVKKVVRTEEKHVTVPIRREDVVIERVPISRDAASLSSAEGGYREPRFQEETIDILLHEEELQVTKRPVVREEVVVRTVLQAGEKEAVATLRHEDAEFEDTRVGSQRRPEERESPLEARAYGSPGWHR